MANKSTPAAEYLSATEARKTAEADRNRRGDDLAPQDEREIAYLKALIAEQAASDAFQASAHDVVTLRGYVQIALMTARNEFAECEYVATEPHVPRADTAVTREALEACADLFNERASRVAAMEARHAAAQRSVASALEAFGAFVTLAKQQRERAGLPRLPLILSEQRVDGLAGSAPYRAPRTAAEASAILDAIAVAAKPKPVNGPSANEVRLREAVKSRDCRLARDAESRALMQRGRAEPVAAPTAGFVSR